MSNLFWHDILFPSDVKILLYQNVRFEPNGALVRAITTIPKGPIQGLWGRKARLTDTEYKSLGSGDDFSLSIEKYDIKCVLISSVHLSVCPSVPQSDFHF